MNSRLLATAVALAATVFTLSSHAQTGRPSALEVQAAADMPRAVVADQELGSYGRYLMLNGATREAALAAARNIDHPSPRDRVATRDRVRVDLNSPVRR